MSDVAVSNGGNWVSIKPDQKVFGSGEHGFYIITPEVHGFRYMMVVRNGKALAGVDHNLYNLGVAAELEGDPSKFKIAAEIWPELYKEKI